MTRILASTCAVLTLAAGPAFAQAKATITGVPEIPFTTVPNSLKLPPGEYLGESVAVATNPQGNIFISDGYCNNRVVKYDKNGRFVAQVGSEKAGNKLGEFNLPHGLQVDERGHVWVADRTNTRYQELDNDLKPIREITNLGTGWTLCISPGPHQYIFFSNSNPNGNPPGSWESTGEIYKAEIDGTVIGKFGKAGKIPPGFQVVHKIDCRNSNELILGEIESWRVQKYILQPAPARPSAGR